MKEISGKKKSQAVVEFNKMTAEQMYELFNELKDSYLWQAVKRQISLVCIDKENQLCTLNPLSQAIEMARIQGERSALITLERLIEGGFLEEPDINLPIYGR